MQRNRSAGGMQHNQRSESTKNLFSKLPLRVNDESGSISLLIIGLFMVTLVTSLVLVDISAVYLAKRSLIIATESAAQRGMKNIDSDAYYQGTYNLTSTIETVIGNGEEDPGIPIDCIAGERDAEQTLSNWARKGLNVSRVNLSNIIMTNFECDGYEIFIETQATAKIPMIIPFAPLTSFELHAHAGGLAERAATNNYSGFDFG